jgi:2-iminoacetate synthase
MSIPRRFLSPEDVRDEVSILASRGLNRVLLVAGDYPSRVTPDYLVEAIAAARSLVPEVDLEVAPVREEIYGLWNRAGAGGVVCYQETYDTTAYADLHPRGPKSFFGFRLGTPERAGRAGITRLGLGVLLDVAHPGRDLLSLIAHARFLMHLLPEARLTVSLPRLRPAVPEFRPAYRVDEETLLRFYAILRLALPGVGLVGSTRESTELRRRLLRAGITQMSAGSVTVPGGYRRGEGEGGQFEIEDHRSVDAVRRELGELGYDPR